MAKTVTSTLTKWGNSQGVRIPKEICALVGARPGDAVTMVGAMSAKLRETFL